MYWVDQNEMHTVGTIIKHEVVEITIHWLEETNRKKEGSIVWHSIGLECLVGNKLDNSFRKHIIQPRLTTHFF